MHPMQTFDFYLADLLNNIQKENNMMLQEPQDIAPSACRNPPPPE